MGSCGSGITSSGEYVSFPDGDENTLSNENGLTTETV